jgi:hypothetical protein
VLEQNNAKIGAAAIMAAVELLLSLLKEPKTIIIYAL